MSHYFQRLARALLGMDYQQLSDEEKRVIEHIARHEPLVENLNEKFAEDRSTGQRLADRLSAFGGSWGFILIFLGILVLWMWANSWWLTGREAFDPYPYILLNLVLSTLAAVQAPIIMMSQNRQSARDRVESSQNYQVSLKTDLEIMRIHQKLDGLTEKLERLEAGAGKPTESP